MRVTIVQGAFLPVPPVAGGAVEKLWFELGGALAQRGIDVLHLSKTWPGLPRRDTVGGVRHLRVSGFDHPRSPVVSKLMDLAYSLRCLAALTPCDVIVTNTFFLPLLLRWRPRLGAVYVSVHRFPQGQMGLYRHVARLQCVSTAVADAVRLQSPAVAAKVKVVPNYVSGGRSAEDCDATWSQRRREVLYVGRIHPEKGLDLLIAAFAAVEAPVRAGWTLRVVGPHVDAAGGGGESYLASLKGQAGTLGVEVDWTGPIYDKATLDACYARASVFVYPSIAARGEAFGLAPLEAMAQGCPVITSDLACFADFVEPGRNADVFALGAGETEALRDCLRRSMHDPARRRRQASAALVTAQQFSLARVADAFVADFNLLTTA